MQKPRVTLINKTGKELIARLSEEYPEYTWVLTMRNQREVCIGMIDSKPIAVGADYETIVDNLNARA